jgi:hypothetical protein
MCSLTTRSLDRPPQEDGNGPAGQAETTYIIRVMNHLMMMARSQCRPDRAAARDPCGWHGVCCSGAAMGVRCRTSKPITATRHMLLLPAWHSEQGCEDGFISGARLLGV